MKTKLLFMAVLLLTMLSTRAVAQDEEDPLAGLTPSEMREQMKVKLQELTELAPSDRKGIFLLLKDSIATSKAKASPLSDGVLQDYTTYRDSYAELTHLIESAKKYLDAYEMFSDNMSQLKTLIDNFNADTEPKRDFKSAAQNVYAAYKALSDNDMIVLTWDDMDNLKEYMDYEKWIETQDVNEENMGDVASADAGVYASTYDQFNGFFGKYVELFSSIFVAVDGTGTAASPENLTSQLKNPDLSTNEQWWGTDWASLNSGCSAALQLANEFDTYQQVNLPAGYYALVGYGIDRREKWENIVDNDGDYKFDHRTAIYAKVGEGDTLQENTQYILPLTADITSGKGNIYSFEKAGVTYYAPNGLAQYRAWEDAKAEIAGKGHAVVLKFEVSEDTSFGKLGFVRRSSNGNCVFFIDGMELYYATDNYPSFTPASADVDDVTIGEDGWSTLYAADAALDFSGIQGLTAYTADLNGSTVTLTQVDNVPAGTGVMLKGEPKTTYRIPRIASSNTNKGFLVGSTIQNTSFDKYAPAYGIFVFDNNEFKFVKKTEGVVAAGTPYVVASIDFASLKIALDGPAPMYDLTLADGSDAHGTVTFTVDGNAVEQAEKDNVVTVSVTPTDGYSAKDVTVRAYTSWEAAGARRSAPELLDNVTVTKQENGTWTFTMPEANVWVAVSYAKNVQDAWIQAIAGQTYTGEAIEPAVTVMDGETTLVLNTDYTVAYSNNVETGSATVTVTGTGNYSGTATATFTILADKSELNGAIAEAEAYYNSISESNPEAAATFLEAINTAKAMQDNTDATQEEVRYAVGALTIAKTNAEAAVLTDTKNALGEAIAEAEDYLSDIMGYEAYDALNNAITAAKQTLNNENATQTAVDKAIADLATAKTTAEAAVLEDTKEDLGYEIDDVEAYYNSIKDNNPAAAEALQTAINAAKGVKDNPAATKADVEEAFAALIAAVSTAQVEVSRITLTIPAKSYVARIDADNRQIENAVAGVQLFTVKNVTNTEVELTEALSVIEERMPYLIYNASNEEVEVSLIMSDEAPDYVDYDSEHFKGTLEDKTFTGEDMQEADHYVLSQSGQNFVWVKDAGTLAAGKCWIELVPVSDAHARTLNIVFEGEATGIKNIEHSTLNIEHYYDLQGRRVNKPTKGMYIVDGKKVVVK